MPYKEILKKYNFPQNFINRELSWLEFNRRVLEEALNPELPLLDKVKFISIFSSNLDEFFMIRVSGLKGQIAANIIEPSLDGLTPIEQMKKVEKEVQSLVQIIIEYWKNEIIPDLKKNNIFVCEFDELKENEQELLNEYFKKEIFPVLTPLAFDPGRPFPYISNLSLSLAVLVKKPNGEKQILSTGYNGSIPGDVHCEDDGCLIVDNHCIRTVHAEMNAITQCSIRGTSTVGATAYVTNMPCTNCAKALIAARIKEVIIFSEYHDTMAERFFEVAGVPIKRLKIPSRKIEYDLKSYSSAKRTDKSR